MAGEAYRQGIPSSRAIVDLGGARSVVTVALRNDDASFLLLSGRWYRGSRRSFLCGTTR